MKPKSHWIGPKLRTLLLLAWAASGTPLQAVEPWAEPRLPVKEGLTLWLDAGKVKEGRVALGIRGFDQTSRRIDVWPDASGMGHHLRQPKVESRPVLESSPGGSTVRFDGKGAYFSAAWTAKFDTASVFLVAAPRTNA